MVKNMARQKGTGGPLDIMSNIILIIIGFILVWYGSGGGSLSPVLLIVLGLVLIGSQIAAIIG